MNMLTDTTTTDTERRAVGKLAIAVAVATAVILGIHPSGSTDLYDDSARFIEHISVFWMVIHLLSVLVLACLPVVIASWADTFTSPAARVSARVAHSTTIAGVAVLAIHLIGTDMVTFAFYEDTLNSGLEGAAATADGLLRLHAATLMALIVSLFLLVPLAAAVALWLDGERGYRLWLPFVAAACSMASVVVTLAEKQFTTLSEMVLFRVGATLLIVWIFIVGRDLRAAGTS